jgi:hypothetical protein
VDVGDITTAFLTCLRIAPRVPCGKGLVDMHLQTIGREMAARRGVVMGD